METSLAEDYEEVNIYRWHLGCMISCTWIGSPVAIDNHHTKEGERP